MLILQSQAKLSRKIVAAKSSRQNRGRKIVGEKSWQTK